MTAIESANGTKTEVRPGVWRLRVYVGRNANGSPVQRTKTIRTLDKNPKPGAGTRLADRELANMIAEVFLGCVKETSSRSFRRLLPRWKTPK